MQKTESSVCDPQSLLSRMRLKLGPRISRKEKPVKRRFSGVSRAVPGRLLDLQGMVEKLGQVIENGLIGDNQGGTGSASGRL